MWHQAATARMISSWPSSKGSNYAELHKLQCQGPPWLWSTARHNSGREIMPQRVELIGLSDACQLQVARHTVADLPGTERQTAFARHAAGKDVVRRRGPEPLPLPE